MDQNVQEGDAQEENEVRACKILRHHSEGKKDLHKGLQRKRRISGDPENTVDHKTVEHQLQKQLCKLLGRNVRFAHEISCDQDKAIDADLPPSTEDGQEKGRKGQGVRKDRTGGIKQPGIDHVVVRDDQEHGDNAVQLDIRISYENWPLFAG